MGLWFFFPFLRKRGACMPTCQARDVNYLCGHFALTIEKIKLVRQAKTFRPSPSTTEFAWVLGFQPHLSDIAMANPSSSSAGREAPKPAAKDPKKKKDEKKDEDLVILHLLFSLADRLIPLISPNSGLLMLCYNCSRKRIWL